MQPKVHQNTALNYPSFGSPLYNRGFAFSDYRYGFNRKEKDDEIKGNGNSYNFGNRIQDPRLGIWLSLDPLQSKYPNVSPYVFCNDNPIVFVDPDGKDPREAGEEINIDFKRFVIISAKNTESFKNNLTNIRDPKLFAKALLRQEAIEDLASFGFARVGLSEWGKSLAKKDPEFKSHIEAIENFEHAAYADSYQLKEYTYNEKGSLVTKITNRTVENLGKGFEASVTLKEEYNVEYFKDDNGTNVGVQTLSKRTFYSLQDGADKSGKITGKVWHKTEVTYDKNGHFTVKSSDVPAKPINKNSK